MSRPLTVDWDTPPETVAAAVQRAITEERYEDAGHPTWSFWLVRGTVTGRRLNLRLDMHSRPGSLHGSPAGFDLRGDLVPHGSGTRLFARAAMLNGRWERPLAIGVGAALGIPMLLVGGLVGVALCLGVFAAFIALFWVMMALVGRSFFSALPQAGEVLRVVGATPRGSRETHDARGASSG